VQTEENPILIEKSKKRGGGPNACSKEALKLSQYGIPPQRGKGTLKAKKKKEKISLNRKIQKKQTKKKLQNDQPKRPKSAERGGSSPQGSPRQQFIAKAKSHSNNRGRSLLEGKKKKALGRKKGGTPPNDQTTPARPKS